MMKAVLSNFKIEKKYDAVLSWGKAESIMPRNLYVVAELDVFLGDDDVKELEIELLKWAELLCGGRTD